MDKALMKTAVSLLGGIVIIALIYVYIHVKNNPSSENGMTDSWIEAEAMVTGRELIMNENWLSIEYTARDGIKYRTRLMLANGKDSIETIGILYNPEKPKEVVAKSSE